MGLSETNLSEACHKQSIELGEKSLLPPFLPRQGSPMEILNDGVWVSRYLQQAPFEKFIEHLHKVHKDYYWSDNNTFDYGTFAESDDFKHHVLVSRALKKLQIEKKSDPSEHLALWLNIYNAICIHIVSQERILGKLNANKSFFSRYGYELNNLLFSLDDIEHGILRCNSKPYGSFRRLFADQDPRRSMILLGQEPRIHFAMYSACFSSPQWQVYSADKLNNQLEKATRNYLDLHVSFEPDSKRLVLPKLFYWYADDFGDEQQIIQFVANNCSDAALKTWLNRNSGSSLSITYQEFNWEINHVALTGLVGAT